MLSKGAEVSKGKLRMHHTTSITLGNEFDGSCQSQVHEMNMCPADDTKQISVHPSQMTIPTAHAVTSRNSCLCSEYTAGRPQRLRVFFLRKVVCVHTARGRCSILAYYFSLDSTCEESISHAFQGAVEFVPHDSNTDAMQGFSVSLQANRMVPLPLSGLCSCTLCSMHCSCTTTFLSFCQSCQIHHYEPLCLISAFRRYYDCLQNGSFHILLAA